MNLQELQAAIAAYRATANEDELIELSEMLIESEKLVSEHLKEMEWEREESEALREEEEWLASEEGKEEAEHFANTIDLWYNVPDPSNPKQTLRCFVCGDRRKPLKWTIWVGDSEHKFTGSQSEAMHQLEKMVGTGTPTTTNPNGGAKCWQYRWYDYGKHSWLDEVLQVAA